ncbi:MAG: hypothetical protein KAI79_18830 [Bacteroidales bacterium]|nr:hypothetical protein [Bacteroidales bacterium]
MAKDTQEAIFAYVKKWQSGKKTTMKSFAESIGMSKHKFEYWVRKFRTINKSKANSPDFIELNTLSDNNTLNKNPKPGQKPSPLQNLEVELNFPSGLRIKIYS